MLRLCVLCVSLLLLCLSGYAIASPHTTASLYQQTIPLASTEAALREAAFSQAFSKMLIVVSGNSQVNKRITSPKKPIASYVSRYSYQGDLSADLSHFSGETLPVQLNVEFDPEAINQLLQNNNVFPWTSDRQPLLVWIVVHDHQGSRLLTAEDSDPLLKILQNIAQERAVPILIPTLDLAALKDIPVQDLNENHLDLIEKISSPYHKGGVLLLQFAQTDATWMARSQLLIDEAAQGNTLTGSDETSLLDALFNSALNDYAGHYTELANHAANTLPLQVSQINSLKQYVALQNFLSHLSLVTRVQVVQVEPSTVRLELTVKGDADSLKNALAGSNQIFPLDATSNVPNYAWQSTAFR